MTRWTPAAIGDLTGRTALVTGPSRGGLGHHVARRLAEHGAHVVLAGRSPVRLDAAAAALGRAVPGASTETLVLDLADLGSVRTAAEGWRGDAAAPRPLHLLVNNAGVMGATGETADGLEVTLATNHLGPFLLTGLLLGSLLAAGDARPARVVTVSSLFHHGGTPPLGDPRVPEQRPATGSAYASSKLAGLLFTRELQRRADAAGLPLLATAAHPGYSGTRLFSNGSLGRGGAEGRRRAPAPVVDAAMKVLGQPPSRGAWPVLMAATADLPGDSYCGPRGLGELRGAPRTVGRSALARDDDAARRLWEVSEAAVGLTWP